jgi:L-iditol 2-dehydrogenase
MIALSLYKNKSFKLINKKISKKILPNQCRLKILYSGICASDIPRAFDSMAYKYPLIMGHEFVGRIINTGTKVNKFEKGDLVSAFPLIPCSSKNTKKICEYCSDEKFNLCEDYDYYGSRSDGSFCEVLDVNEWNIFKLKVNKNIKLYSLIEPTAVSFNIFESFKKKIENKSKILILGAGYIGQIIFKILKNYNKKLHIHIVDRNKFKLDLAKTKSSTQILLSKDFNKNESIFKKLNTQFDIVIETTGNDSHFLNALDFAKKEGTVIYSGNINKGLVIKKNQVSNILRKQLNIKGIWNSTFKSKVNNWKQAEKFITKNFQLERLITHTTDLNDAADLMKQIYLKKNGKLKNNYLKGVIKNF